MPMVALYVPVAFAAIGLFDLLLAGDPIGRMSDRGYWISAE